MRISPKLLWMQGYIKLGLTYLPDEVVISRVSAWGVKSGRGVGVHACIYQDKNGHPYRIWMHTHYYLGEEVRPFSKIDLLGLLAHELAHTVEWKHTPKHKQIESKILSAFMRKLKREGYVSEEEELTSHTHKN